MTRTYTLDRVVPNISAFLILLAISINPIYALSNSLTTIERPTFDFSTIGNKLEFAGQFDSVSFFNYPLQQYLLTTNVSDFNASLNTLYYQDSNANVFPLGDLNGQVDLIDSYGDDGFIIAGSFDHITLIGNSTSPTTIGSLAYFNITSNSFTNLDPNNDISSDAINAIYGDVDNSVVYIAGKLTYKDTYGALIYNFTSNSLSHIPFKGFNQDSEVTSISKAGDNTLVFGGSFYALGVPQLQYTNQTYYLLNEKYLSTNTSSQDNSTTTEEVYIQTEQLVSFKYASFEADNTESGSVAASEIICPTDSDNWLVNSGQLGAWLATLPFTVSPSKIRVYNSRLDDTGVKTFRLYTSPSNSIMNLTYIDPTTNTLMQCDAWCPLFNHSDLSTAYANVNDSSLTNVSFSNDGGVAASLQWTDSYQDFGFVNDLEVDYLNFHIIDYFGSQAGLNGIQMFSTQILTFGNDTLNEASCGTSSNSSYSSVNGTGWDISVTGQYMTNSISDVSTAASENVGVTFYPNITYAGNYSIDYITPGCQSDNTCDTRGTVQVNLLDSNGTSLRKFTSAQTNQFEKIENLWDGHLNISDTGRPSIEVTVVDSGSSTSATIVVDKVAITVLGLDDLSNSTNSTTTRTVSSNSSISFNHSDYKIPLNGLFEYSLINFTKFPSNYDSYNFSSEDFTNKFVGNSSINQFGATTLPNNSIINSLEYLNDTIYVAGQFTTSNDGSNLLGLSVGTAADINNNLELSKVNNYNDGLNGEVKMIKQINNQLFVVGDFNDTVTKASVSSLSSTANSDNNALTKVAVLSNNDDWFSLDSGIANSGEVAFINTVTIDATEFFIFYDSNFETMNVWDNLNKKWFSNDDFNTTGLYLNITGAHQGSSAMLMSGHLAILGLMASSAVSLDEKDAFSTLPINFSGSGNVINQLLYVNDSFTVVGGNFTADSNESNLLLNNNGKLTGFDDVIDWSNSSVTTLSKDGESRFLFIGLDGVATYNNDSTSNVFIYDLVYGNFSIPGAITKSGSSVGAEINTFYYDGNYKVYVGGDFDTASALPCQSFCTFDMEAQRWENDASTSISSGVINYMNITSESDQLLIAGEFVISGSSYFFTNYDFDDQSFKTLDQFATTSIKKRDDDSSSSSSSSSGSTAAIPGEINRYILVDGAVTSGNRMLVMGDNFVSGYNKSNWVRLDTIGDELNSNSTFSKFQLIDIVANKSVAQTKGYNTYFDSSEQALLVVGNIVFNSYSNLSMTAAIFNGTAWIPYLYTTTSDDTLVNGSTINDFLVNNAVAVDLAEANAVKHLMDRGWIVFIGLALAVGTMMLLVLLALVILFWKRKHDGYDEQVQRIEEDDMVQTVPPDQLFSTMDEFKFTNEKL
ncbi:Rax2 protein [Saccharomycopsis crataegensis]|uniref:Rax2 protein n=1 Tax=Saccharomycopsis crataegensis TaxID=43959 RepID=A0AAV5QWS3_9ASCO|nr:Rax2 protein [Saccharomycopsis crataegensis]